MRFRTHAAGAALVGLVLAAGCFGRPTYGCDADAQCVVGDVRGFCEDDGLCSYVDGSCTSGRRYSPYAGASAEMCVPAGDDGASGGATTTSATQGIDDGEVTTSATPSTEGSGTGCGAACPEPGVQLWSTRTLEPGAGRAHAIARTDSGIVVTGEVSVEDRTELVVATFEATSGGLVEAFPWPAAAGGPDRGRAIAPLASSEVVVAGSETSGAGSLRGVVFAADAAGEPAWTHRTDTLDDDAYTGVATDDGGRVVAVGASGVRAIATLLDAAGQPVVARVFDPPAAASSASFFGCAAAAGAGSWVTGAIAYGADRSDLWVRRLGADAGVLLDLQIDDASDAPDVGTAIASLPSGEAIVGGVVAGNAWIARIDTAGALAFSRAVQDGGSVRALAVADDGTIVAAGHAEAGGQNDAWVAAFDGEGDEIWVQTHDTAGLDDEALGLSLADGVVHVAGYATDVDGEAIWVATYAR